MFIGLVFVDASAQAILPLPRPSSTALHRVAMTASAVTLRGCAKAKTTQRLTRSSLTGTGRTKSSRPFRCPSRTSRPTAITLSPVRTPTGIQSVLVPAASGAFVRPSLFSDGVCSPPSSVFSLRNSPIKSQSYVMSERTGLCVKCVAKIRPFIFLLLTHSIYGRSRSRCGLPYSLSSTGQSTPPSFLGPFYS